MRKIDDITRRRTINVLNGIVLLLSVLLIAYISVNTFNDIPFLTDRRYMTFQLWVCIVFIADFIIELWMADDRWRYVRRRWCFLLLSIPYLNIIEHYHITLSPEEMYFARFIPLARGGLAVAIVAGYISTNRVTSMFASYLAIMVGFVYFGSLIFLEEESGVNPMVPDFGAALWWACLDTTTLGSPINPVTAIGKIIGGVLACMGMLMFPLFTVFITDLVQRHVKLADKSSDKQSA